MGSASELRAALEAHGSAVFGTAYRIVADRALAEEVAQDVFLELWRTRKPFASPEHLRFWLRRVAVHRATDALRRAQTQPACCSTGWEECAEPQAVQTASLPPPLAARIASMLGSLPEAMRVALVLRYGEEEMAPEEIAAVLGQPVASVKSNLARGLALLRRKASVSLKEFVRG